ncbi:MAG TPA: nicotinate phosphoribosyltransferase [Candidatus Limnocylindrales bacterium]|nr:nicotinate phosphoribosyltransferase [Candidatus Limnocylindrales bacterium]
MTAMYAAGRVVGASGPSERRDALPWVGEEELFLLTDRYELTMLQGYWAEGMHGRAVFSLFVRRLPKHRNFLLACGLDTALAVLERLRPSEEALAHLRAEGFAPGFVDWLAGLRFTGDVWAVPEGTPLFPAEPILEVEAPLPEAQVVESLLMNQVHVQTVLASKAVRVKLAAGERAVVDFGLRRMHGADAALKAARAFHVAGVDATSNVLAGKVYGMPVSGTMAHSYVQAHDDELSAFRAFAREFPDTVLLVDTYDTLEGVRNVVRLAEELGPAVRVGGVRLDSGDLGVLAVEARRLLDGAGLGDVEIFASGGLDEWEIRRLLDAGAPIDGFGVGTRMGVSTDAPALDIVYKLTAYEGRGRLKLSSGKHTLPGRKQIFRLESGGVAEQDVVARAEEQLEGRPLLRKVMEGGVRLAAGAEDLERIRARAKDEIGRLPPGLRRLDAADPPYAVHLSERMSQYREEVARAVGPETEVPA